MKIRVEVKSDVLGDSIFWEGEASKIGVIRNICAKATAEKVVKDGRPRVCGMWHVSVVPETEKETENGFNLLLRMRNFEADHEPEGWPAIQMKDVSSLCRLVEELGGLARRSANAFNLKGPSPIGKAVVDFLQKEGLQRKLSFSRKK